MPSETLTYYFPMAETNVVVTETVGCDAKSTMLVSASSVVAATTYSRDSRPSAKTAKIDYSQYGGPFSDADLALSLTSDGRLSGINSTTAGSLGSTIASATTLATTIASVAALYNATVPGKPSKVEAIKDACKAIADYAHAKSADGSGKLVTLTYTVNVLYANGGSQLTIDEQNNPAGDKLNDDGSIDLMPDPDSVGIHERIPQIEGMYHLSLTGTNSIGSIASWSGYDTWDPARDAKDAPYGYTPIELNKTRPVVLNVMGPDSTIEKSVLIWAGPVSVPTTDHYPLLVPNGTLFGSQNFTLSLSDDGGIAKLEYSTKSSSSDLVSAGNAIAGAVPTNAMKASSIQAQADLIYQQQRLVICKTTPASCAAN
ncbi:MAG TPA: hypothetical protein VMD53_14355 [Rhizomicrobium sp.]|nr:hypothetical protein [Rhizomicrobium sp.]